MQDHSFSTTYSRFLGKLYFKLQNFKTCSYNIQIIHILMRWNHVENEEKIQKKLSF
jgi:hypothetical protein